MIFSEKQQAALSAMIKRNHKFKFLFEVRVFTEDELAQSYKESTQEEWKNSETYLQINPTGMFTRYVAFVMRTAEIKEYLPDGYWEALQSSAYRLCPLTEGHVAETFKDLTECCSCGGGLPNVELLWAVVDSSDSSITADDLDVIKNALANPGSTPDGGAVNTQGEYAIDGDNPTMRDAMEISGFDPDFIKKEIRENGE